MAEHYTRSALANRDDLVGLAHGEVHFILLDLLREPGGRGWHHIPVRAHGIDPDTVEQYRQKLRAGMVPPPVRVYLLFDDSGALVDTPLSGGMHRCEAADAEGHATIAAQFLHGTMSNALYDAISDNEGLPFTKDDQKQQTRLFLLDPTWNAAGHKVIAAKLHVPDKLVSSVRKELEAAGEQAPEPPKRVGKDSKRRPSSKEQAQENRARIADTLRSSPGRADYDIAREVDVSNHTVASVRKDVVAGKAVPGLATAQNAQLPITTAPTATTVSAPTTTTTSPQPATPAPLADPRAVLAQQQQQRRERTITDSRGRTYTRNTANIGRERRASPAGW